MGLPENPFRGLGHLEVARLEGRRCFLKSGTYADFPAAGLSRQPSFRVSLSKIKTKRKPSPESGSSFSRPRGVDSRGYLGYRSFLRPVGFVPSVLPDDCTVQTRRRNIDRRRVRTS